MKICTDPGHGGPDAGGASLGTPEKQLVLVFQSTFWQQAAARGHCIAPTRAFDDFIPLSSRAAFANQAGADVFVSIHCNAGAPAARGAWTIYAAPSAEGRRLALIVQRHLASAVPATKPDAAYPDDSDWVGNRKLAVLRRTAMPAILLELGFMTSRKDMDLLESRTHMEAMAAAVLRGLEAWGEGRRA